MKIFLTGGTGFIGRRITGKLLMRGWEVIALVRNLQNKEAEEIKGMGARLVCGDITDRESIKKAMQGADAVIHNAGMYKFGLSKKEEIEMQKVNVGGTKNTLGLAVELNIPKIVHVSTILIFGATTGMVPFDETHKRGLPPQSLYEQTKTAAHEYAVKLQQQGAPIVIACPAGVIGPGDHSGLGMLARMYIRGVLPPVLFAGSGKRTHVYVDDAAEAIVRCVEKGRVGECYLLGADAMYHRETFKLWQQTPGGSKKTLFWIPNSGAILLNSIAEPVERLLGLPILFSREFILAALAEWEFSCEKAERELDMKFRSCNQAWLETLEGERAIRKCR